LNAEQNCACLPDHKFLCIRLINQQKGNENLKLPLAGCSAVLLFSSPSAALSDSFFSGEQKKARAARREARRLMDRKVYRCWHV